jgi:hypothetical protein
MVIILFCYNDKKSFFDGTFFKSASESLRSRIFSRKPSVAFLTALFLKVPASLCEAVFFLENPA